MLFTGSTVEEAIQAGLKELQIPRHKAHITVVAREKKGFLGIGKKPAQVKVEAIKETTVQKADQQAVRGVPDEVNQKNAPVKSVSEETRDLSRVVAAVKKAEQEGELVDEDVKVQILKNDKPATTILEESGQTAILQEVDKQATSDSTIQEASDSEQDSSELVEQISTEPSYKVETVASEVASYLQTIIDGMDVEAELEVTHSHRSISVQVETNEPGRVIGYHGKVLKSLQLLAQNYIYNNYARNFYITVNVNDYAEHRAEVLQGYAQKVIDKVLETGSAYHTDPMSNNERKMIHRIVSKINGVTSYSEGNEPHRYVVIDIDGQDI
ncbi:RNA-binding cell elongation regulator Jag/EloR [Streptococcus rifensis]